MSATKVLQAGNHVGAFAVIKAGGIDVDDIGIFYFFAGAANIDPADAVLNLHRQHLLHSAELSVNLIIAEPAGRFSSARAGKMNAKKTSNGIMTFLMTLLRGLCRLAMIWQPGRHSLFVEPAVKELLSRFVVVCGGDVGQSGRERAHQVEADAQYRFDLRTHFGFILATISCF